VSPMTFRQSLSFLLSASFASALALAACSGEVAGTPPGSSGGGGMGTCAGACMRIYQLPCTSSTTSTEPQCEQSCTTALAQAQKDGCTAQINAVLACYQSGSITCDSQGQANTTACDAQTSALDRCANPPPPGCGAIPYPGGSVTECTGFGGGGGPDGGTGTNTQTCSDGRGNSWTSTCSGSTCSCGYNGMNYCSCTIPSGTAACCPGT
jgi:hypothetical protein